MSPRLFSQSKARWDKINFFYIWKFSASVLTVLWNYTNMSDLLFFLFFFLIIKTSSNWWPGSSGFQSSYGLWSEDHLVLLGMTLNNLHPMFSCPGLLSNLWYKAHQIPKLWCFSSRLTVVFAQSIETRCSVENEDVVRAAPTGDASTTSDWSTILLPTKVWLILILEVWW